jgi:DNA-binding transcriptional MerR regulator
MSQAYRVRQFAELAGITVRTLHHYDRLKLLQPARSGAGYRLYGVRDLERLEQIVALKFLGIPLKQIKPLLERDASKLPAVLRKQRHALEEKRRRLDQAIDAIRDAEKAVNSDVLKKIIEVIEMQDNGEQLKQYYSDEAWQKLAERREKMTPAEKEQMERGSQDWAQLFQDVEALLASDPTADPAGAKAQALAARWKALIHSFTGGDPGVGAGLKKAWTDRPNWSPALQRQSAMAGNPKVFEFMGKAMAH